MLKHTKRSVLVVCLISLIFMLRHSNVYANAPPSPAALWLTFEYQMSQQPRLSGIQLIECATDECENPRLLQQYGVCNGVDCLIAPAKLTGWSDTFECISVRCRVASASYDEGLFKLIVQFSDRTRMSQVVGNLPSGWGEESAWRVIVRETRLILVEDDRVAKAGQLFLTGLVFTQFIELLIASIYLRWLESDLASLLRRLRMIFMINLATFPVVWFFFPSLGQFQPVAVRRNGLFVLILSLYYASVLAHSYLSASKKRRITVVILALLTLPVLPLCYLVYLLATGADYRVPAAGLSPNAILLASEAFVIMCEAALLATLSKRTLSLRQAGLLSLALNTSSCLLGLAFHCS